MQGRYQSSIKNFILDFTNLAETQKSVIIPLELKFLVNLTDDPNPKFFNKKIDEANEGEIIFLINKYSFKSVFRNSQETWPRMFRSL